MLLNDSAVFVSRFKSPEWEAEFGAQAKEFTNVDIKNFKEEVNDESLKELFSQFGKTLSVKVMRNPGGKSKWFDFVSCEKHEYANRSPEEMNEKEITGEVIFIGPLQRKKWMMGWDKVEIWIAGVREFIDIKRWIST